MAGVAAATRGSSKQGIISRSAFGATNESASRQPMNSLSVAAMPALIAVCFPSLSLWITVICGLLVYESITSFVLSVEPSFTRMIRSLSVGYSSASSELTVAPIVSSSFQHGTIIATEGASSVACRCLRSRAGVERKVRSINTSK
jgi:hypothetical protein